MSGNARRFILAANGLEVGNSVRFFALVSLSAGSSVRGHEDATKRERPEALVGALSKERIDHVPQIKPCGF